MSPPALEAAPGVLLRLGARDRRWPDTLPAVPDSGPLTVTLGHPRLLPINPEELGQRGYRIVGVAAAHRPIGATIDILVPGRFLAAHTAWVADLGDRAQRVFDLRMGPVREVLAAELALHERRGSPTA